MMVPEAADALVVVGLAGFYGGLSRELSTTADFLDTRLGLGLSLGPYVAVGVALLLSLAAVAVDVTRASSAGQGLGDVAVLALGLSGAFLVIFGASFWFGTVLYDLLLRIGLTLS